MDYNKPQKGISFSNLELHKASPYMAEGRHATIVVEGSYRCYAFPPPWATGTA
jgi:hypothetical protein